MEFLHVDSLGTAQGKLIASANDWLMCGETLPISDTVGRVLAEDIVANEDIPAFRRSSVDGYAVVSKDTAAAGESIPVFLAVKGSVEMGAPAKLAIRSGECAEVPTGGMLPDGADAVVMVEYTEAIGKGRTALHHSVAYGENVVQIGEDAAAGAALLRRGKRLAPQDVGALAAAGITEAIVYKCPKIVIISTGDELVPPGNTPMPGQIRDINTYALAALARKHGFTVAGTLVLPDDEPALEQATREAMAAGDVVAISGGSSKGAKDKTRAVIERIASPGVYTHGLAIKPGKPTILAFDEPSKTILAGLPGHPVSAIMVFELLFGWLMREMTGCAPDLAIPARLSCNVASAPGMLTCWPVTLSWMGNGYVADPVFGKSGLITTLAKADGYFSVERNTEGLPAGTAVMVHLF